MSLWGGTKRRAEGMVGFVALSGVCVLFLGFQPNPVFQSIGIFGIWLSTILIDAHWLAIIQSKVGLELQGRVLSINRMLASLMIPLGFISAGPLADKVFEPFMASQNPLAISLSQIIGTGAGRGMGLLLILLGCIEILWTILGYHYRPLRYMEDLLPDAIPDTIILADKDKIQEQADQQLKVAILPAS